MAKLVGHRRTLLVLDGFAEAEAAGMLSSAGSTARGRHMLQTFGRDGNDSSVGLPAERHKAIKAIEAISYQSPHQRHAQDRQPEALVSAGIQAGSGTDHCTIASCSAKFRRLAKL